MDASHLEIGEAIEGLDQSNVWSREYEARELNPIKLIPRMITNGRSLCTATKGGRSRGVAGKFFRTYWSPVCWAVPATANRLLPHLFTPFFFLENAFIPFRLLIRTFGECRRCLLQHAIELIKRRKQQGTRGENRVISCDLKRRRPHSYCLTIQVARVSNRFLFVVLLFHFLIPQLSSPTTTPRQPFPPLCSPLPDVLEEEEKCLLLETSTAVAHFQIRKEELDFNI